MGTKKRRIRGGLLLKEESGFLGLKRSLNVKKDKYIEYAMPNLDHGITNLLFLIKSYNDSKKESDRAENKKRIAAFCNAIYKKGNQTYDRADKKAEELRSSTYNNDYGLYGEDIFDLEMLKKRLSNSHTLFPSRNLILSSGIEGEVLDFFKDAFNSRQTSFNNSTISSSSKLKENPLPSSNKINDDNNININDDDDDSGILLDTTSNNKLWEIFRRPDNTKSQGININKNNNNSSSSQNLNRVVAPNNNNSSSSQDSNRAAAPNNNNSSSSAWDKEESQSYKNVSIQKKQTPSPTMSIKNINTTISESELGDESSEKMESKSFIEDDEDTSASGQDNRKTVYVPEGEIDVKVPPTIRLFGKNIVVPTEIYMNTLNSTEKDVEDDFNRLITEENKEKAKKQKECSDAITVINKKITDINDSNAKLNSEIKEYKKMISDAESFRKSQQKILRDFLAKVKRPDINIGQAIDIDYSENFMKAIYFCINTHPKKPDTESYYYVDVKTPVKDIMEDNIQDLVFQEINNPDNIQSPYILRNIQNEDYHTAMFSNREIVDRDKSITSFKTLLTRLKDQINKLLPLTSKLNIAGGSFFDNIRQNTRSVSQNTKEDLQALYDSYRTINFEGMSKIDIDSAALQLKNVVDVFEKIRIKKRDGDGLDQLQFTEYIENFNKNHIMTKADIESLKYKVGEVKARVEEVGENARVVEKARGEVKARVEGKGENARVVEKARGEEEVGKEEVEKKTPNNWKEMKSQKGNTYYFDSFSNTESLEPPNVLEQKLPFRWIRRSIRSNNSPIKKLYYFNGNDKKGQPNYPTDQQIAEAEIAEAENKKISDNSKMENPGYHLGGGSRKRKNQKKSKKSSKTLRRK
jgi:hypothetical protein